METKKTFFDRLSDSLTPSEIIKIKAAYIFAKFAHRAQKRKELDFNGNPLRYFEHVRRVAILLIEHGEVSADIICTALLHDTLEDTEDITPEIIEQLFGSNVCRDVIALTKTNLNKDFYISNIKKASRNAINVKLADKIDNCSSSNKENISIEFEHKTLKEAREFYEKVFQIRDDTNKSLLYTLDLQTKRIKL